VLSSGWGHVESVCSLFKSHDWIVASASGDAPGLSESWIGVAIVGAPMPYSPTAGVQYVAAVVVSLPRYVVI